MKKALITSALLIIVCIATFAQVGLLSSNNKSDNSNQNSKPLPTLSFTKGFVNYERLNDSFQIKLKFDTVSSNSSSGFVKLDENTKNLQNQILRIKNQISEKNNKTDKSTLITVKREVDSLNTLIENNKIELAKKTMQFDSAIKANAEMINDLTTMNYKKIHDFLTKLESINKSTSGNLYGNKYKINSYWFLIDSSKQQVDKTKFLDSLTMVYQQVNMESDDNADTKNSIREEKKKLDDFNDTLQSVKISSANDYSKIKTKWLELASDTVRLSKQQKDVNDSLESTVHFYESLIKNNIKDKSQPQKDVETKEFGAFPQLTDILGKKEVIPTLQLYGSYTFQNITQSFETNLGISFSPTGAPDTANLYTIFIPTASKFLVHSNFTWSFLPVGTKESDSLAKKIGLRLDVSFASKNLLYDTVKTNKTITSSFLYAKAGIELGIIPKRLSIYSNINTATILDQVDDFQNGTGVKSKFLGYIDCGARLYFDPTPTAKVGEGLFIYSNLNFIINSGDVKRVTKSNNTVIPSIQVGLVKSLGKF